MAELCLGTVQFGMYYGVNNAIGRQPTKNEVFTMLDYAFSHGIDIIDTACAYGEAELLLGTYFKQRRSMSDIRLISKLRPNIIEADMFVGEKVNEECKGSLMRLGVEQLDGYLLHTPEYIYNGDILAALSRLKKDGYVKHIGVSIYDLKEGYAALDTGIMDYIQLPYSILDQRGIKDGFIKRAKKEGIKIFTRSAFLQGLLLMDGKAIPVHLQKTVPYLAIMDRIIKKYRVDKVAAILQFVKEEQDIDYLVFGVETKKQLVENIDKAKNPIVPKECILELKSKIDNVEDSVILPSLWANGKKTD